MLQKSSSKIRICLKMIIAIYWCLILPITANAHYPKLSNHDLNVASNVLLFADKKKWFESQFFSLRSHDHTIKKLALWLEYRTPKNRASFEEIIFFIQNNPTWPELDILKIRAEEAINSKTSRSDILKWFSTTPPITANGIKYYAIAKAENKDGRPEEIEKSLKLAWIKGNFGEKEEQEFIQKYGHYISTEDHIKKIDELLWQEKTTKARKYFKLIPANAQNLFEVRAKFIDYDKYADIALDHISPALYKDPGLLYARIRYAHNKKDSFTFNKLILESQNNPPYPNKWWQYKKLYIREALKRKDYGNAYKIAKSHDTIEDKDYTEGEWLAGWIALRFQSNPNQAIIHFSNLYNAGKFPVTISRGAYWIAKSYEKLRDEKNKNEWYKQASRFPDSFYGQLAITHISEKINVPKTYPATHTDINNFTNNELTKAAYIFMKNNNTELSKKFISTYAKIVKSPGELTLVGDMVAKFGKRDLSVSIAKEINKTKHVILSDIAYPTYPEFNHLDPTAALSYAIIRQESNFNKYAESPKGALGLMQLLPSTAQNVSKELNLPFEKSKLKHNHLFNITLGHNYLKKMVDYFDGSYLLAVAAYNAGHGNVKKWVNEYGDPRDLSSLDDIIDWIELIPFSETRSYVQRVFENWQMYQIILGNSENKLWFFREDLN